MTEAIRNELAAGRNSTHVIAATDSELRNFEVSPLRFLYEALLEEYRVRSDQINMMTASQQQVTGLSLAAVAAFGAVAQMLMNQETTDAYDPLSGFLLLGSLTFSAFTLMCLWYDLRIAHMAGYINSVLRPKMERLLSEVYASRPSLRLWEAASVEEALLGWELAKQGPVTLARYAFTFLPSLLAVIWWWVRNRRSQAPDDWEIGLAVMAGLGVLLMVWSGIWAIKAFWRLPDYRRWLDRDGPIRSPAATGAGPEAVHSVKTANRLHAGRSPTNPDLDQ